MMGLATEPCYKRGLGIVPRVPNTVRRQGVYHFRRAVPRQLQERLGKNELVRSLETADAALARCRSRIAYLVSEDLFTILRCPALLTDSDLARLMQDFYRSVLERENDARLLGKLRLDGDGTAQRLAYWSQMQEQFRSDLATNNFDSAYFASAGLIQKHGLQDLSELETRKVQQSVLRAGCEIAGALKARFEGDFTYTPKDPLLTVELARAEEGTAPAPAEGGKVNSVQRVDRTMNGGSFAVFGACLPHFRIQDPSCPTCWSQEGSRHPQLLKSRDECRD
jgi:hypothetical protein